MQTAHYLILANDPNGESLELIVEATSKEEAETMWRKWVVDDFGGEVDEYDICIFSFSPLTGTPHVLQWGINAVCLKDTRS